MLRVHHCASCPCWVFSPWLWCARYRLDWLPRDHWRLEPRLVRLQGETEPQSLWIRFGKLHDSRNRHTEHDITNFTNPMNNFHHYYTAFTHGDSWVQCGWATRLTLVSVLATSLSISRHFSLTNLLTAGIRPGVTTTMFRHSLGKPNFKIIRVCRGAGCHWEPAAWTGTDWGRPAGWTRLASHWFTIRRIGNLYNAFRDWKRFTTYN